MHLAGASHAEAFPPLLKLWRDKGEGGRIVFFLFLVTLTS